MRPLLYSRFNLVSLRIRGRGSRVKPAGPGVLKRDRPGHSEEKKIISKGKLKFLLKWKFVFRQWWNSSKNIYKVNLKCHKESKKGSYLKKYCSKINQNLNYMNYKKKQKKFLILQFYSKQEHVVSWTASLVKC